MTLQTTKLSSLMSFDNGFAFQSSTYLPAGRYKIITIKNVQDGNVDSQGSAYIDEFPSRMKSNCILHISDVLLSLTGNVGRVGIVCENNLLLNQRVAKCVPKDENLLSFIYFVMRQPTMKFQMETIAKGTAQPNLSPVETLKLKLPFEKISAFELSSTLKPFFDTIIHNNMESLRLSAMRDALLPKLMSGELDVSSLDI